jgi:hypothetical protein
MSNEGALIFYSATHSIAPALAYFKLPPSNFTLPSLLNRATCLTPP